MNGSLSAAFEITEEDVAEALQALDMPHDDAAAETWWGRLDRAAIAVAACDGGTDLDDQSEAAQQAIRAQLLDLTAAQRLAAERHEHLTDTPGPDRHRPRRRG